jgi:hypothetical protein
MKLANFSIIKFIRRRCDSARNHKKFFMCVQPARFNQMIGVKFSVATERLSKLFHEFHMRNWFSFPRELENPSNRWSTKISLLNSNKRKWIFSAFHSHKYTFFILFPASLLSNELSSSSLHPSFHTQRTLRMWKMKSESHTIERERWNLIYGVQVRDGWQNGSGERGWM